MIFHNAGKYDGDESKLPQREHPEGAVPFKEVADMKKMALITNGGCAALIVLLAIPYFLVCWKYIPKNCIWLCVGGVGSMLSLIPHEFLHALCFKKDVYMYNNLAQGLMFVVGTEDMSKGRFVLMCLLPNLVFGVVPYVVCLFIPSLVGLGMLGCCCIGMGFGDYMNVFNALRQMPKGSKTYLSGMHSYWYLEEQD